MQFLKKNKNRLMAVMFEEFIAQCGGEWPAGFADAIKIWAIRFNNGGGWERKYLLLDDDRQMNTWTLEGNGITDSNAYCVKIATVYRQSRCVIPNCSGWDNAF